MILRKSQIFCEDGNESSLSAKAVKNGFITVVQHVITVILQLITTPILARFIMPESYGLIAMVSVVMNFVAMFKEAGLSMATIQKEKITEKEVSNLFWINALISLGLCLIVCLISPLISFFYGRDELVIITIFMAISLGISGLAIQHTALLKRNMQFSSVAVIEILSYAISTLSILIMAILKLEYWALIIGQVINAISVAGLTFYFCRWVPKGYDKSINVSKMVKYGLNLTEFEIINYFTRNLDNILIGKFCGPNQLGLYSKAYQIVYMPVNNIRNPINSVAIPVMSKIKSETERFKKYFETQVTILSALIVPLMTGVCLNAHNIILILFGENWIEMETCFKILAFVAIFQPVMGVRGSAFISLGLAKLYLKAGIIGSVITIISFVAGITFGVNGVAFFYAVASVITQFVVFPILFKNSCITLSDLLNGLYPVAISTIVAAIVSIFIGGLWGSLNSFIQIVLGFVVLYITFFAVMMIIPRGRSQIKFLINLIMSTIRRRKNG